MSRHHKHDRDDKRSRWQDQAQHWKQQRDDENDDKPPPEPDSEPVPVNTTH